jgi:hypothetical protein
LVFVAAKHQIDWRVQPRDIVGRQVEQGFSDLKADTYGRGEMPQYRVQPVAWPCERINDADCRPARSPRNHFRNIVSYRVTEWVFHSLNAASRQYAHARPHHSFGGIP